ncbi:hypothetical protein AVEN_209069-1 [Araneus ventricosus]|uniref:Uncharacterized protein n=1 Tax=Araneus ventricosus TaxID=182803 RepID=A0A4Y2UGC4_ARAVE|nr:hypothetical protein AVEN_35462-1 [Araneus ventricosus]GBO11146.1 hypothetical protein AVEN_209069-1 [Araneus ventricosus]
MKLATAREGGLQVRNPIPPKVRRVWGLLQAKSYTTTKRPPSEDWRKGEGVSTQASSSLSDRGSQLHCASQNSLRIASKLDVM